MHLSENLLSILTDSKYLLFYSNLYFCIVQIETHQWHYHWILRWHLLKVCDRNKVLVDSSCLGNNLQIFWQKSVVYLCSWYYHDNLSTQIHVFQSYRARIFKSFEPLTMLNVSFGVSFNLVIEFLLKKNVELTELHRLLIIF